MSDPAPEKKSEPPIPRLAKVVAVALLFSGILVWLSMPTFSPSPERERVARARSDMRSLATALETYYADFHLYPAHGFRPDLTADGAISPASDSIGQSTFVVAAPNLTTPIAYINSLYSDPFASVPGTPLRYQRVGSGWILGSYGPDRDQATGGDLHWDRPVTSYDPENPNPTIKLSKYTYDPSNGTVSEGDLWRIQQPPATATPVPLATPLSFTYDPTNGTDSGGGIYRITQ